MRVVNKTESLRLNPIAAAKEELLHPTRLTHIKCTPHMLELVLVAMKRWRDNLLDTKKPHYITCLLLAMFDIGFITPKKTK